MRKMMALFLIIAVIFGFAGCNTAKDEDIIKSVDKLKSAWTETYKNSDIDTDGYFEIKNTRVINIKENSTDEFGNADKIVEFLLYTDYFGSAPYYSDANFCDTVIIYKDGSMKVQDTNPINRYRNLHYINDFSEFIESVDDYGDAYNCIEKLK